MSQQTSPWIEGAYGWSFGESNWNAGMDQNLLKFSFLFDRNVDGVVGSLPPAVNGEAYFLTTDNRLYFAVGNNWFSTSVPKWFEFKIKSSGDTWQFDGTVATQIDGPSDIDARFDAVELSVTNLTADLANAPFVRQFLDITTLTTNGNEGRFAEDRANVLGFYSTSPGVGGGDFWWDALSVETADNVTIFQVSGVVTGRWKRFVEGTVYLEWAGILGDGITTEDSKVRAAIAATPEGGTLVMPSRDITILLDIPTGQGNWPAAAVFDKAITVQGSHACLFKLKDFTASYVAYAGVVNPGLSVFRVSVSDVELYGLNIDANADNHYETVGLDKVWEEGPGGKRPPNGILIIPDIGTPNIERVKVKNCKIYRPLGGVVASGTLSLGGPSLDDATFFNGQLSTDTVVGCEFSENLVTYARGNDYLFVSGVRNSKIHDNDSVNSMYHQARFYAGVEDCHMFNNRGYVDYTQIAARWNPTDLGYWRTDNPAGVGAADYKIERSGFAIGSSSASTFANSGNIRRCSMRDNRLTYADNTSGSAIADFTQTTFASFFSWVATNGIVIDGNESHNSPSHGLGAIIAVTDPFNTTAQGVIFSNNTVNNAARQAMSAIGAGFVFTENRFINCGTDGSGLSVCYVQGGSRVYRNTLVWQRAGANTNNIFEVVAYGPAGAVFISDNIVTGYTGTRLLNAGAIVVHGTDAGGVLITPANSWANADTGDAAQENPLRATIDCAGNVTLNIYVTNPPAVTSDIYGVLPVMYRPQYNIYHPILNTTTGNTVLTGRITTAGNMLINGGNAAADNTEFSAVITYKVRPVI